jgi:hypothetical protein
MTNETKKKKTKNTFIIYGMTFDELGKELKQLYHAELEGMPVNPHRRCYLCKRKNGDKTIARRAGENKIRTGKVRVEPTEIGLGRAGSLVYYLCFECFCLLSRFPRHAGRKR